MEQRTKPSEGTSEGGSGQEDLARDGGVEPEEAVQADESKDEEVGLEVDALLCLGQMDSEAAAAYEVTASSTDDDAVARILRDFAADHRQHVTDIRRLVTELGGELYLASPDPATSTFTMMAEALSELGTSAGLRAMIASENFTNAAYDAALELIAHPLARAVLERNFADEQRHVKTLVQLLERAEQRPIEKGPAAVNLGR